MKCPNCGKEVPEDRIFCGFCGSVVPEPERKKAAPEPDPTRKVKKPRPAPKEKQPSPSAGLPKWVIPAVAGALVIIVLLVVLFSRGGIDTPVASQPAEPDSSGSETEEDQTPAGELVTIPLICEEAVTVGRNDSLRLRAGWYAVKEAQVKDYLEVFEYELTLDGNPISFDEQTDIFEYDADPEKDIQGGYGVEHYASIGKLSPRTHMVDYDFSFSDVIYDGFDEFGPDTDFPGTKYQCEIIVE